MKALVLKFPNLISLHLLSWGVTKSVLTHSWPYLAIIAAHVIWGTNFIVAKLTLQEIPPMSLAFLRFLLATLFLLPFLITQEKKTKISKSDLPTLVSIGIFMVTLNIAFFYLGLVQTSAINASILTMVIPVLSVLGAWWFLKEKVYSFNLVGILLGLAGALLVIGVPLGMLGTGLSSQQLMGNLLIMLASASWVIGAIISKKMLKKYSTLTVTSVIFLVGLASFLVPALKEYLQNPQWYQQVTYLGIFGLFFIAIASSVSAYFLFEWGLSKLGVIKADLFQYLEPIVTTTLGVFLLNESFRLPYILGALFIGLGVYWATFAKEHHKHHKAHRV